jgi:diaminohydroxyphosphoribosylaminopyrimidine deaminase/5-amino-6-(5-phosphoribosylamino)uracil reductase
MVDSHCMPADFLDADKDADSLSKDEKLLRRALELARRGVGLASPNPCVGAVIADALGNVVGTGTYTYDGVKHAEVLALEAAGSRARGATLYINLEPHAHLGRTPPCTDALIAAGIRRVVASMGDPNPKVSGLGFEKLRAAGVQVEVGRLEEPARRLNEGFARYIRHGMPLVTLKSAMTLDGKIAPPPEAVNRLEFPNRIGAASGRPAGGFSGSWITGEAARAHVQELRHQNDALLVGVGTILADDPLLTDRSGQARRRHLLRVILDSHLRLPLESRLVQSAAAERRNDVLVFCALKGEAKISETTISEKKNSEKKRQLEQLGIRVEMVAAHSDGRPDLLAVLRRLGELEIASLMIEGGSTVNGSALASNLVDKVFLYYAPKILGGGSIPFAAAVGFHAISPAQVKQVHLHRFGEDFAVEGYLRDPYGE